ncbi:hypothetical protein [Paludisphaera sp.]|uniref:hypothetical protein n=1 Tax=Paludisphaera sp. TaxID=2017432 RepID=UPI00301DCDE4
MYRMLRLGAPALALSLIVGCGAEEAPGPGNVEDSRPSVSTPAVPPSTDEMPNPAATRRAEPSTPIPSETEIAPPVEADPKADAADPKADAAPAVEGPEASKVEFTEDELANIKKLPADEQEAALKQGLCPVSGENLGMDVPIKMTAEGRDFYICCEGCKGAVEKDPKGVLAKLDGK